MQGSNATVNRSVIFLLLLVLACGSPSAVRPTIPPEPTPPPEPTDIPQPTSTPTPTAAPRGYVSHAMLGDAWPLTVEDGTIICSGAAILLRTNRGLFAVNGTARGQHKWKDIRDITRPDPNTSGLIMSVQPIIDRGLDYCK